MVNNFLYLSTKLKKNNYKINEFSKSINVINKAYPIFLSKISIKLNKIHGIKWNAKVWEIVIGYWLKRYLIVILDRLKFVEKNLKKKDFNFLNNIKSKNILIPKDINDFTTKSLSDEWNEELLRRIYNYKKKRDKKLLVNLEETSIQKNDKIFFYDLKVKLLNFFTNLYVSIFCKKSKVVLFKTYFNNKIKFIYFLYKLREFPIIYFLDNRLKNLKYSKQIRLNLNLDLDKNEFYKVASALILECIPKTYIEEFSDIIKKINNSSLPKEKKIIFTSNIENDSIFKFWIAIQKNKGGKLILAQHGNGFNHFKLESKRDYELSISDKYLSYGWTHKSFDKKILKYSIINHSVNEEKSLYGNNISIIMSGFDNFISFPSMNNYLVLKNNKYCDEMKEISKFLNFLSINIKKNIIIRPHPSIYRVKLSEFENKYKKVVRIDNNFKIPFSKLIKESQINFIPRISSTPFSHCMSKNFPTVTIFPYCMHNYLDNNFRKVINNLIEVGVCHNDYVSLLKFIESNFNNFSSWWLSRNTQNARKFYCSQYAKNLPNKLDLLINIILSEKNI